MTISVKHRYKRLSFIIKRVGFLSLLLMASMALAADTDCVPNGSESKSSGTESVPAAWMPDETFGNNGKIFISIPNYAYSTASIVFPSGKSVLAAGSAWNDAGEWAVFIAKLNHDGTLDDSFGDNGIAVQSMGKVDRIENVMLSRKLKSGVNSSEALYLLATVSTYDYTSKEYLKSSRLLRFSVNGQFDRKVVDSHYSLVAERISYVFNDIRIDPSSENIYMAGYRYKPMHPTSKIGNKGPHIRVEKYNSAGVLLAKYENDKYPGYITQMHMQYGGKLLVGGSYRLFTDFSALQNKSAQSYDPKNDNGDAFLLQLHSDTLLPDSNFSTNGFIIISEGNSVLDFSRASADEIVAVGDSRSEYGAIFVASLAIDGSGNTADATKNKVSFLDLPFDNFFLSLFNSHSSEFGIYSNNASIRLNSNGEEIKKYEAFPEMVISEALSWSKKSHTRLVLSNKVEKYLYYAGSYRQGGVDHDTTASVNRFKRKPLLPILQPLQMYNVPLKFKQMELPKWSLPTK